MLLLLFGILNCSFGQIIGHLKELKINSTLYAILCCCFFNL